MMRVQRLNDKDALVVSECLKNVTKAHVSGEPTAARGLPHFRPLPVAPNFCFLQQVLM